MTFSLPQQEKMIYGWKIALVATEKYLESKAYTIPYIELSGIIQKGEMNHKK